MGVRISPTTSKLLRANTWAQPSAVGSWKLFWLGGVYTPCTTNNINNHIRCLHQSPRFAQYWTSYGLLIFPCLILSTHWCCLWYRPFTKLFLHVFANWRINNVQIKHPSWQRNVSWQWNPYPGGPGISKTIKPPSTSTFRPGTSVFRASSRSSPRAKRCPNCESANSWMAAWVQTSEGVLRIGLNLKQRKCRYMNICKFFFFNVIYSMYMILYI